MKVESVTILHYGATYLYHALKTIYDQVDVLRVVYSPHPTHGTRVNEPCPETEAELREIAQSVGPKVDWRRVTAFWHEGQHRDYAVSLCDQADIVLTVDADEVWNPTVLESALKLVWDGSASIWRLRFVTPWRSFNWICRDDMLPERFKDQRPGRTEKWGGIPPALGEIHHFGYAVSSQICKYKISIHGHLSEFRPNWFEEKWKPWPPVKDVHPTCVGFWNPEPYDKMKLPPIMRLHPCWDKELID